MDGKVTTLRELIARYLMPGTSLHLAGGIGGPAAAICEVLRQFKGKRPGFTLVQSTVTGHAINLLHAGLVKKALFAASMDLSTSGRPSRVTQEAWAGDAIQMENWSLNTLQQRLFAGAMGIGYLPTRSLTGSTLAEANRADYSEVPDPFTGEPVGLVRALKPDVSIVHGVCADEHGNTILQVPWGEDLWGALAARTVLVTVEKIVPAAVIHANAALVKLPGHAVAAVAEAPFGLHPFPLAPPSGVPVAGYETDTAFLVDLHNAFAEDGKLDAWLREWVYGCKNHEAYLSKLGSERRERLRYRPARETPKTFTPAEGPATQEEIVLVAAAREIGKRILTGDHRTILAGAGNRAAAVLLAYYRLKEQGHHLDIVTGNGQLGYEPRGGALGTQGIGGVYESAMLTDTLTSLGVFVGGARNRCLSVLGVGQVDRHGNTNSTLGADGRFLVGSGGANDAANASEVLVVVNQSKDRFPAKLPYVTCPGKNVTTVVTDRGVFRKNAGTGELELAACLPDADLPALVDRIKRIRENCGWEFKARGVVEDLPLPEKEELDLLRSLVPPRPGK